MRLACFLDAELSFPNLLSAGGFNSCVWLGSFLFWGLPMMRLRQCNTFEPLWYENDDVCLYE